MLRNAVSTIFCTQYRQKDWPGRFDRSSRIVAILDCIVYNSTWIETGDYNMREHAHPQ